MIAAEIDVIELRLDKFARWFEDVCLEESLTVRERNGRYEMLARLIGDVRRLIAEARARL